MRNPPAHGRSVSLARAWAPAGLLPPLPPGPPYACAALGSWADLAFELPCGDTRLLDLQRGGPAPHPALDNLVGLARAWSEYPEWMDFLDPRAPNHRLKLLERDLYLHHFGPWLGQAGRVLDAGGGSGRFAAWLTARGAEVELVDPDPRALRCALRRCAGHPGRLDLHWTTVEALPPLTPVDCVLAVELLCYVEDAEAALAALLARLRPGGVLLGSVEAPWGWAASPDAPPGTLEAALHGGPVHVPGDRWVRTFGEAELRALLGVGELLWLAPTHYACSGPLEGVADPPDLPTLLAQEEALRRHPIYAPLNRAWTFVLRRP